MRKGLTFVPPLLVFRHSPHYSGFSRREEKKSYLNIFRNLAVYSFCLQMLTLWVFLYSGFRSPTLSWGLFPGTSFFLQPSWEISLSLVPALWPFVVSIWSMETLGSLAFFPANLEKARFSHCCPVFCSCHCSYSSLPAFVLLQATVNQQSLCSTMPTSLRGFFLALWSSWLCISWSNVGLVRFYLSGSFFFLKYILVVQRSLWASISWLGSTNAIKSKLDHLLSRKVSSIISPLEFSSSFTLAGSG